MWITILTTNKMPNRIWKALKDKFARENTTSFYKQLSDVLNTQLTSSDTVADYINRFNTNWNRLQHRCSIAKSDDTLKLPYIFKDVMESLEAKDRKSTRLNSSH